MAADGEKRLLLGIITGVHGVRGEVVIKSFTADPLDIDAYGPLSNADGSGRYEIKSLRATNKGVVARVTGVADRNAAERLKGVELHVERARLPAIDEDDAFYNADLIGLAVRLTDGGSYGRVAALHDFGAGDLIEIAPAAGGPTVILPFTRAAVPVIDLAGGFIVVDPPVLIEDEEDADASE